MNRAPRRDAPPNSRLSEKANQLPTRYEGASEGVLASIQSLSDVGVAANTLLAGPDRPGMQCPAYVTTPDESGCPP